MSKLEKLLEKSGLLYSDTTDTSSKTPNVPKTVAPNPGTSQQVTNTSSSSDGDIIKEAYEGLPKSENDIYMVEKLMQNFNMLPDETKPAVVKQTLETMHVDVGRLVTEAVAKKNALGNAFAKRTQQVTSELENLNAIIAEAEKKISDCKKQQLSKKNGLETANKKVEEETKRLDNIIKILGGGK